MKKKEKKKRYNAGNHEQSNTRTEKNGKFSTV